MPIWWPDSEIIGDRIDQAKRAWEGATSNIAGIIQQPDLLGYARGNFEEAVSPIISGLSQSVETDQRVNQARAMFDQATAGIGQTFSDLGTGLSDFNRRATEGLNTRAAQYEAERPGNPLAVPLGAAGDLAQGYETTRRGTQTAIESLTGQGRFREQPNDLGRQLGAGLDVATTPFTALPRTMTEGVRRMGAPEEVQNATQGVYSLLGPGGAVGSVANAGRLALAGAGAGALIGAGSQIAQGRGPSEVLRGGLEGAAVGANVGEMVPMADRFIRQLPGGQRVGEAIQRLITEERGSFEIPEPLARRISELRDQIGSRIDRTAEIEEQLGRIQEQRAALQETLNAGKIEIPSYRRGSPFAGQRLSQADLYELARRSELNPHAPGWWQAMDAETVRLYRQEAKARRGPPPPTPEQEVKALRAQERELAREAKDLDQQLLQDYNRETKLNERVEQLRARQPMVDAGQTPRVQQAVQEITAIRNSDVSGAEKNAAIRAVFDRYPDLTDAERAAMRAGTPRQRPQAGPGSPVPPARPPEAGRVQYPESPGLNPQSEVPIRPGGVEIPPGQRAMGEGNMPTGQESQPPLGDIRRQAVPPVRPGGGDVPTAPPPEGVGIMAPGRPAGTPQMGMEGMPPTREGTVYPERVAGIEPAPAPEGIGIMSTPRTPLDVPVRRGVVDPEAAAAVQPAPPEPGIGIMSTPRTPLEPSVRRGMVDPAAAAAVQPVPAPEGVGIMSTPRSPLEPPTRVGDVLTENLPSGPRGDVGPNPQGQPSAAQLAREPNRLPEAGQPPAARVEPGTDPQLAMPLEATDPPALTRGGRRKWEQMVKEAEATGMSREAAEQSVNARINDWRATMPRERLSPDLREPDPLATFQEQARRLSDARYRVILLSNPATAVRDIISNAINIPRLYARTAIGAGIEGGAQRLGRLQAGERATTMSQLSGLTRGIREGSTQALEEAWHVITQGGTTTAQDLPDTGRGLKRLPFEFGYRIRIAADTLITNMVERAASYSMAYREADRANFNPGSPEWTRYAEDTARRIQGRMQQMRLEAAREGRKVEQGGTAPRQASATPDLTGRDLGEDAIGQLAKEAFGVARRAVFQQQTGKLTSIVGGTRRDGLLSWVVPFFNTTANISAEGLTMNPLTGPLGTSIDIARAAAGRGPYGVARGTKNAGSMLTRTDTAAVLPMSQRIAEHGIGALAAVTGGILAANGLITDLGPPDASVRRRMMDEGWRPGAIRTPNGYVPIAQLLGPLASPLLFGVALHSIHNRGQGMPKADIIREFLLAQEGQWAQGSGLRDYYELLNAVLSPDPDEKWRSIERMATNVAGQYVNPGILRTITQATDPVIRDPRNIVERLMVGVPGLSGNVEPRRTETGRTIRRGAGETGIMAFSPIQQIERQQATRRYPGSRDAAMDAEITSALNAVRNWERDPTQYARPTARQRSLYARFDQTQSDLYVERARAERVRRRQRANESEWEALGFRMPGS